MVDPSSANATNAVALPRSSSATPAQAASASANPDTSGAAVFARCWAPAAIRTCSPPWASARAAVAVGDGLLLQAGTTRATMWDRYSQTVVLRGSGWKWRWGMRRCDSATQKERNGESQ